MGISYKGTRVGNVYASILDPIVTQETGDSAVHVMSQKAVTKALKEVTSPSNMGAQYANALKGTAIGEVVSVDDMTPLPAKVKVVVMGKNHIAFPYADTNKTENGITWTVNADRTVTANGTATASSYFHFEKRNASVIAPFDMTLSGCPSGGGYSSYELQVWREGSQMSDIGPSIKIPKGYEYKSVYAVIRSGCTVENLTFKPMLSKGVEAWPYIPPIDTEKKIAVKSCGKDIFNIQGIHALDGNDCYLYEYQLKPNTKYTFSSDVPYTEPACVYANGTSSYANGVSIGVPRTVTTDSNGYMYLSLRFNAASTGNAFDLYSKILDGTYYLQIEEGEIATAYEPYIEGETITTAIGETVELAPIAPNMTITSDTAGALLSAEYIKDTNKVIEKLTQAIISLGGNI